MTVKELVQLKKERMKMKKDRIFLVTICIVTMLVLALTACAPTAPAQETEAEQPPAAGDAPKSSIALILPGSIADGGWNTLCYKGLEKLQSEGFKTAYTENVTDATIASVTEGYVNDGYSLIIGGGWQFVTPFMTLAPDFPDAKFFVVSTGPEDATIPPNLQFFDPSSQYSGYMAGALAALLSKTNIVGFIGGGDNGAQRQLRNAFIQGATETVEGTKALDIITGDYNDAAKGREAALTLIGNGADVVWHAADITGLGVIAGIVESKKALAIGCYSDQTGMAYSAFATSIYEDLGYAVYSRGHAVEDGTFEGGGTWKPPFYEIFYFIAGSPDVPYNTQNVPPEVVEKMDKIMEDLKSGKIEVTTSMD